LNLVIEELFGFATVQGPASPGLRAFGVPPGGAFDEESRELANLLVGRASAAPAVELALARVRLRALSPCAIGVAGAEPGRSVRLEAGDALELEVPDAGCRVYLAAVAEESQRPLRVGDRLEAPRGGEAELALSDPPRSLTPGPIRWIPIGADRLGEAEYALSPRMDRTGLRIDRALPRHDIELPSEPMCVGAVQWSPDGTVLIAGPDGPMTGGYPKLGAVASVDLDRLGQLRPGQSVQFAAISPEEARQALEEEHHRRVSRGREIALALALRSAQVRGG
jgi:5-oxoprolinase (ATP-hydrolysing) subunit C